MISKQTFAIIFCFVCLCCSTLYRLIHNNASDDMLKKPYVNVLNAPVSRLAGTTPLPVQFTLAKVRNVNISNTSVTAVTQRKSEITHNNTALHAQRNTQREHKAVRNVNISNTSVTAVTQRNTQQAHKAVRNFSTCTLIVLVLSSRQDFSARTTIRETWGKNHDNVLFVIGASCHIPPQYRKPWTCIPVTTVTPQAQREWSESTDKTNNLLMVEQQKHQDIIQMQSVDVYRTLALKLKAGYDWVIKNTRAQWVLKIDTDCVVRVNSLETYLASTYDASKWIIVAASINRNTVVPRRGKWAEYPEFTASAYPPWPSGAGHVISRPIAQYVSDNKDMLFNAQGEDVALGIWLHGMSINHAVQYKSDKVFLGHSGDCYDQSALVIGHQVSLPKMRDCYAKMDEIAVHSSHAVLTKPSHEPSLAEIRRKSTMQEVQSVAELNKDTAGGAKICKEYSFKWPPAFRQKVAAMINDTRDILTGIRVEHAAIAGTLLGMLRHRNFIPWDDDIDVYIRLRDTEKVASAIRNHTKYCTVPFWGGIKLFECNTKSKTQYKWSYPYIDIFTYKGKSEAFRKKLDDMVWPAQEMYLQELKMLIPKDPNSYLVSKFGRDWKSSCVPTLWDHRLEKFTAFAKKATNCMSVQMQCGSNWPREYSIKT